MTDEPFGRQPKPVEVIFTGDQRDIDHYMIRISQWIEDTTYDVTTLTSKTSFKIYPRAVND